MVTNAIMKIAKTLKMSEQLGHYQDNNNNSLKNYSKMGSLWIAPMNCQELHVSSPVYVWGVVFLSFGPMAVDYQIFGVTQILAT